MKTMNATERLETAVIGTQSAQQLAAAGGASVEQPVRAVADRSAVHTIIAAWSPMPQKSANQTIDKYGLPNEAMPSQLIWYNNGPWKRTIVYRDEVLHNFPAPHTDVIEQVIDYLVPPDKCSELAQFDGSVIVERTKGEVSARCDMEPANILALNLMHDIVTGICDAQTARTLYAETTGKFLMNEPAPYAEALQFKPRTSGTQDHDQAKLVEPLNQAVATVTRMIAHQTRR